MQSTAVLVKNPWLGDHGSSDTVGIWVAIASVDFLEEKSSFYNINSSNHFFPYSSVFFSFLL